MKRSFRIVLGLALIGYGIYSHNMWFYLGVIPLFFGIINWCPLEKRIGGCDGTTGCCSSNTESCDSSKKECDSTDEQCCEQPKGWSTEPKSSCCSK